MLRHHAEEENAPQWERTSAPEPMPVTPQELAQALVAVETRQQTKARAPTQTVSLEDTIRELELTVTPTELLAELHAQRTAVHQKAVMTPRKAKRSLSWWLMLAGLIVSTTTTIFVSFLLYLFIQKFNEMWRDTVANTARTAQPAPSAYTGLRPLTTFSAHVPAYVTFKDLRSLATGVSPSTIYAARWGNTTPGPHWEIEQENGRYMARVSVQSLAANPTGKTELVSRFGKMEWVSAFGSGVPGDTIRLIPIERFRNIQDVRTIQPNVLYPPTEQVLIPRGKE